MLTLHGKIGRCNATALVDSGASSNFVSREFVLKNKIRTERVAEGPKVQLADGSVFKCNETIDRSALRIGPFEDRVSAYVFPLQQFDVILGTPWLKKHNPVIYWRQGTLELKTKNGETTLWAHQDYELLEQGLLSSMQFARAVERGDEGFLAILRPAEDEEAERKEPKYTLEVEQLLEEFQKVLSKETPPGLPPERAVDHKIELEPGHSPPSRPTYRMSYLELAELKRTDIGIARKRLYFSPASLHLVLLCYS